MLRLLISTLAIVAVVCATTNVSAGPVRPNVLWICADDHAPYVIGAYGNRQVKTPNIDRIANSGMRFNRAYCNSPVCTASRQSFLTGRYPRTIGVTQLQTALPESELTLADILGDVGYETISIGKMHFNSELKHGFNVRIDTRDALVAIDSQNPKAIDDSIPVLPRWRPFKDPAAVWLNGIHRPYAAYDNDMEGTYFARKAAEQLAVPREQPLFMMVSFYEPHSPFRYPVEYRNRHSPAEFSPPGVGAEDDPQIPEIFRGLTDDEKRGIIASYYTSVEHLDKNVGLILDALGKSPYASNMIVIYTGDHGYMLGQHGRFEKHCSFEEAVRAPLIIRSIGGNDEVPTSDALVEFVDIVPTILDMCQIEIPATVQGRSLSHLLGGGSRRHRDHVIVEYAQNDEIMIRDERWKLIYERGRRKRTDGYDPGRPLPGPTFRLYDLQAGPAEMHNLAKQADQANRVRHYTQLLVEHLKATARQPELVPTTDDPLEILDFCVQPHDVEAKANSGKS